MLDFDSEDIDGMDADEGDDQEPAPIEHRTITSSHDVYMVDTRNKSDYEDQKDAARDRSPEKQSKRRRKRKAKPHLNKDPAIEQGESTEDEHAIEQPSKQDGQSEQPIPGKDNSPDDLAPDKLLEHQNLHQRLVATARSLKKQKRRLKTVEDALRIRWGKVLNTAHKYGNTRHTKSYPKRKLLPEFDEEAIKPPQLKK